MSLDFSKESSECSQRLVVTTSQGDSMDPAGRSQGSEGGGPLKLAPQQLTLPGEGELGGKGSEDSEIHSARLALMWLSGLENSFSISACLPPPIISI